MFSAMIFVGMRMLSACFAGFTKKMLRAARHFFSRAANPTFESSEGARWATTFNEDGVHAGVLEVEVGSENMPAIVNSPPDAAIISWAFAGRG
jgi:hypothetical protein